MTCMRSAAVGIWRQKIISIASLELDVAGRAKASASAAEFVGKQ